jgi:hypothetical protein
VIAPSFTTVTLAASGKFNSTLESVVYTVYSVSAGLPHATEAALIELASMPSTDFPSDGLKVPAEVVTDQLPALALITSIEPLTV